MNESARHFILDKKNRSIKCRLKYYRQRPIENMNRDNRKIK